MWRYISLSLVLSTLLVYGVGCATIGQNVATKSGEGSEIRIYEVFGMDCPGCHGGLNKLVEKIPEIQQAESNWRKKRLLVTVKPGAELNDEDIYDAIRRANFTPSKRIK